MIEKMSIDKLGKYGGHIYESTKVNMKESISRLSETVSMIEDMQKISIELMSIIGEQQQVIEGLNKEISLYKEEMNEKDTYIDKMEQKEEVYSQIEMDAVKIAAMLGEVNNQKQLLEKDRKQFEVDKELFEKEKKEVISDRDEALSKVKKALEDRNSANISRDKAIKEKNDLQKQVDGIEEEINIYYEKMEKSENDKERLIEKKDWYLGYASAIDQKIIDFFEGNKENLYNHYNSYLNNPEKFEEIKKHFPDFKRNYRECVKSQLELIQEKQNNDIGNDKEKLEQKVRHTDSAVEKMSH